MMTKEEHIKHWLKSADEDMKDIEWLFQGERYMKALYFGHLYVEKICKALWVKNNIENIAPYTHNLTRLLDSAHFYRMVIESAYPMSDGFNWRDKTGETDGYGFPLATSANSSLGPM